jgi:beta-glucanase (GH16 family)
MNVAWRAWPLGVAALIVTACTIDLHFDRATNQGGTPTPGGSTGNAGQPGTGSDTPLGIPGAFEVTLQEDCDAPLDASLWRTDMYVDGVTFRSWGQRADWMADEQVTVSSGLCTITAEDRPSGDQRYTSGVMNTATHFAQREGAFEARLRAPRGVGLWPTFWLRSELSWPPAIVIFDGASQTDEFFVGEFWGTPSALESRASPVPISEAGEFHVYGLDWGGSEFTYYVDGAAVATHTHVGTNITEALYLTINLSIGDGTDQPSPDETTPFPAKLDVDWIRVYRRVE